MKQFRFRLSTADGGVYYCDSVNNTLRVHDNTRANQAGVIFVRCEYGMIERGKVRRWYPVDIEDLRNYDIVVLFDADSKTVGCRALVIYLIGAFALGMLSLAWYLTS